MNHFRYLYTLCLFHGTTFQDILNNEDKFDQFIRDLPQMKALQEEKEMLLTSNKSLAEYNLSQVDHMVHDNLQCDDNYLMMIKMLLTSKKSLAEYNLSQVGG